MARRTKEEALRTRETILDTAEQVFFEKGVSRTSLTDIAEAAGVTRGAIYWHFKNKVDVFTAMFDRIKLPLDELFDAARDAREPDPLGCIRAVLITCLRDLVTDTSWRRVLDILFYKCELTEDMGPLRARHRDNIRDARLRLTEGLANAVARHQLPAALDCRRAATMLHSLIGGLMADWLLLPEDFDLAHDADQLVDGFFDMLRCSPALLLAGTAAAPAAAAAGPAAGSAAGSTSSPPATAPPVPTPPRAAAGS